MDFGDALKIAKNYGYIRLPHWSKEVYIGYYVPETRHDMLTAPFLYVSSRYGKAAWLPNQIEILSNDWEQVYSTEP